jgi:ABC-type phosphonate transport system ATPase subunit
MNVDRHARKQVLLTRIAFQRNELRREFAQVRHATEPRQLLRALVGDSLGGTIGRALFGAGPAAAGDLLAQGLAWLRRYRVTAALIGSIMPALRGGGRWRRVLRVGVIAGAAWLGWRVVRKREKPKP